jgi:hypothetical protein
MGGMVLRDKATSWQHHYTCLSLAMPCTMPDSATHRLQHCRGGGVTTSCDNSTAYLTASLQCTKSLSALDCCICMDTPSPDASVSLSGIRSDRCLLLLRLPPQAAPTP